MTRDSEAVFPMTARGRLITRCCVRPATNASMLPPFFFAQSQARPRREMLPASERPWAELTTAEKGALAAAAPHTWSLKQLIHHAHLLSHSSRSSALSWSNSVVEGGKDAGSFGVIVAGLSCAGEHISPSDTARHPLLCLAHSSSNALNPTLKRFSCTLPRASSSLPLARSSSMIPP